MRTVKSNSRPSIELPRFRITSRDFCDLISKYSEGGAKIEISTGAFYSETRYVFESFDEISGNLPKIVSPFDLKVNSIEMCVNGIHSSLNFEEADRVIAESLVEQLKHYRPWYRFAFSPWLQVPLGGLLFMYLDAFTSLSLGYTLAAAVIISGALLWLLMKLELSGHLPAVVFRPRESFFQKHWEKIIVAVVSSVATALIMFFLNTRLLHSLTESSAPSSDRQTESQ